jgi:phosphate transport system permease protein
MSGLPRNGRPYAKLASQLFAYACAACAFSSVAILVLLLSQMLRYAWGWLDWQFITNFDSQMSPEKAGVRAALVGSIYLIGLTTLFAVPIGVGTAIYLEEYAQRSRWRGIVQTNIANLAGVPSIVYGILGLGLFVRGMQMGAGVLAGALTLTLVVLPIVILASQEALRAVPSTIRQASYALGATRWQTVWYQLLPAALPGIMTGVILALSRALGEAAPLVAIGAAGFVMFTPQGLNDSFTALPLQIYNWTENANDDFRIHVAAAGIIVLMAMLICLNATAVFLRYRFGKRIHW